ncbi:MAG: hypothetical protein KDK39_03350 [Leptospiraceae bacterium]|nr:hypothetical protein [Leptospiraceae bacterium]
MTEWLHPASGLSLSWLLLVFALPVFWPGQSSRAHALAGLAVLLAILFAFRFSNQINMRSAALWLLLITQLLATLGMALGHKKDGMVDRRLRQVTNPQVHADSSEWRLLVQKQFSILFVISLALVGLAVYANSKEQAIAFWLQPLLWMEALWLFASTRRSLFLWIGSLWIWNHLFLLSSGLYLQGLADTDPGRMAFLVGLVFTPGLAILASPRAPEQSRPGHYACGAVLLLQGLLFLYLL